MKNTITQPVPDFRIRLLERLEARVRIAKLPPPAMVDKIKKALTSPVALAIYVALIGAALKSSHQHGIDQGYSKGWDDGLFLGDFLAKNESHLTPP